MLTDKVNASAMDLMKNISSRTVVSIGSTLARRPSPVLSVILPRDRHKVKLLSIMLTQSSFYLSSNSLTAVLEKAQNNAHTLLYSLYWLI